MADRPRRWVLVTLAGLGLVGTIVACWRIDADAQNHAHLTALRMCAQAADVSTVAEVRNQLAATNMDHSYDEASRTIYVMVRGSKYRLVTTDYQILFQFDEQGRLILSQQAQ